MTVGRLGGIVVSVSLAPEDVPPELPELLCDPELEDDAPCPLDDPEPLELELEPPLPEPELLPELPPLVDSVEPPSSPELLSLPPELVWVLSLPWPTVDSPEPAHAETRHVAPRTARNALGQQGESEESSSDIARTGGLLLERTGGVFASFTTLATR
jgi:hypothetical protein